MEDLDLLAGRRLGFACVVLGREGLKAHDARRWQNNPHLRVSIGYLHDIFDYLDDVAIRIYRISSGVAPYVTHPDLPRFWGQLEECRDELAELGAKARRYDLRLSTHPGQFTLLNAVEEPIYRASLRDLEYHTGLLDALGSPPEHKVITHVGGLYGDREAALARFAERYERLPERVKARLVLENDEKLFALPDVLWIHQRVGIPIVWDWLHHAANNPAGIPAEEAVRLATATWPAGQQPKIHYSSQRREPAEVVRKDRKTGERIVSRVKPRVGQHADHIDAGEFAAFLASARDIPFDVMLEAKEKDKAVLRLRQELRALVAAGGHAAPELTPTAV